MTPIQKLATLLAAMQKPRNIVDTEDVVFLVDVGDPQDRYVYARGATEEEARARLATALDLWARGGAF